MHAHQYYSKKAKRLRYIAMAVLILSPFIGFYLGVEYQKKANITEVSITKMENIRK